MKAKLILNNKEYEVEVSEEQVKEIEKPKYKRWRAEMDNNYYYLDDFGDVQCGEDQKVDIDDFRYNIGNYGKTEGELEEYKKKLLYQQQYKDFLGSDLVTNDDWKDTDKAKYCVRYGLQDDLITILSSYFYKIQGAIYSNSKEKIEKFIKKIGEDNFKKYILEVKE